jgi:hypothetical protein
MEGWKDDEWPADHFGTYDSMIRLVDELKSLNDVDAADEADVFNQLARNKVIAITNTQFTIYLCHFLYQFNQRVIATIRLQRWWRRLYYAPTGKGFNQAATHFQSLLP